MTPHLPTLKQLRYFVALEKQKHFARAAAACNVSQSAFSAAVKELEQTLGLRLVDRTNKSVTVTPAGSDIAAQARLCLRDAEMLVELARSQGEPLSGRLNFGVIPTIAPFLLPQIVPVLRDRLPRLELYLREDTTANLLAALQEGGLDLLLLALPYDMRQVEVMRLFRDPFRLACRDGTKRVDPNHYRFDRLQRDSVLLLEDGHCLRDHALAACRIRKQDKVSRFAASSLLTLVQMVNADLGITYLPALAEGSALLTDTNVKTYRLEETAYREIGLVWRCGGGRDNDYRALGDVIRECRPILLETPDTKI